MSLSPNSQLLQRTIDLNYNNKKRSSSLKWSIVNGVLLIVFVYDISCKCPGYTSLLHYVEVALAGVLGANLLQHALRLLPPAQAHTLAITRHQQTLLGLSTHDLDSSFSIIDKTISDKSSVNESLNISDPLSLSLSPLGLWRSSSPVQSPPPSTPAGRLSSSPLATQPLPRDEFISDRLSLSTYLKQYEESHSPPPPAPAPAWPHTNTLYQLADIDSDRPAGSERGAGAGAEGGARCLALHTPRLVHAELNMRRWIHLTILDRIVREMNLIDETFAKHGLPDLKIGQVSVERLREASAGGGAWGGGGAGGLAALLPFLQPFPEQRYVVARIRELAKGGCVGAYKWNGGAGGEGGWETNKPTDAEIIMHLFVTYIDSQIPSGGAPRPFTTALMSGGTPGAAGTGTGAAGGGGHVGLQRHSVRPPHYVLIIDGETVEVCRGRSNVFLTLVVWAREVSRRPPPALRRLPLRRGTQHAVDAASLAKPQPSSLS